MKKIFRIKNIDKGGAPFSNYQQYGIISIKALSFGMLTANQLESVRRGILRKIKRKGVV
jgi:ribosomal protein L16/L10AE